MSDKRLVHCVQPISCCLEYQSIVNFCDTFALSNSFHIITDCNISISLTSDHTIIVATFCGILILTDDNPHISEG